MQFLSSNVQHPALWSVLSNFPPSYFPFGTQEGWELSSIVLLRHPPKTSKQSAKGNISTTLKTMEKKPIIEKLRERTT